MRQRVAAALRALVLLPLLVLCMPAFGGGGRGFRQKSGPPPPRSQPPGRPGQGQQQNPNRQGGLGPGPRQEHLSAWLNRHQSLTPEEQQKALAQEPGFNQLPLQTQQRMQERLRQLDAMSPEQRQRRLRDVETMERLTPQQRNEVAAATHEWGALPQDRRRLVGRAFRDLRAMPPDQRQAALNSERFSGQFSNQERGVLRNLLSVEPYLPRPSESQGAQYSGK